MALVLDRARSVAGASVRGGCARRPLSADWCRACPPQLLSSVAQGVLLRAPTDALQLRRAIGCAREAYFAKNEIYIKIYNLIAVVNKIIVFLKKIIVFLDAHMYGWCRPS